MPSSASPLDPLGARDRLKTAAALTSCAAVLVVSVLRASSTPEWQADMALVRGLERLPLGAEGTFSSLLVKLFALLPLGGRALRASLASSAAAVAVAWLLFELTFRALERTPGSSRFSRIGLATLAALLATLSPLVQLASTEPGGVMVAVALALATTSVTALPRPAFVTGALLGATALEHQATGACALLVLLGQTLVRGVAPSRRAVASGVGGALFSVLAGSLPSVVDLALTAPSAVSFGALARSVVLHGAAASAQGTALATWLSELGVLALVLAALGLAAGLTSRAGRESACGGLILLGVDLGVSSQGSGYVPLRVLALCVLASCGAVGLQTLLLRLRTARVAYAREIAVLASVLHCTSVLIGAEQAWFATDREARTATEVWTHEALATLPPNSVLLVRSEAIALRLSAARALRGERPDVLLIALPGLARSAAVQALIREEPALAALVRDLAINGKPGEFSLATLADARSLYVELDPEWPPRLLDHLSPAGMWLKFAPHPLGRSDRTLGVGTAEASFETVVTAALRPDARDAATLAVMAQQTAERAALLASLGDRDSSLRAVSQLERIAPEHALVKSLRDKKPGRRVRMQDVLATLDRS